MWRLFFVLCAGCVVIEPTRVRPRWHTTDGAELESGCAIAHAFVRKTGKTGFGLAVQLKSRGDCSVELGRAELVFSDGARSVANPGLARQELHGRSLVYAWLPIALDNNEAWNEGRNAAVLEIAVAIGDARSTWRIPLVQDGGEGKNAPGLVELDLPLAHENGDPQRFEESGDPGMQTLSVWANPYWLWGHGRRDANGASREPGLEIHAEVDEPTRLESSAFGVTAGFGFVQYGPGRVTDAIGAAYVELDRRFLLGDSWPVDIGLGPAVYFGDREAGGQLSLRIPLGLFRVRYMATSGIEVMAGVELPIPFFFSRSK